MVEAAMGSSRISSKAPGWPMGDRRQGLARGAPSTCARGEMQGSAGGGRYDWSGERKLALASSSCCRLCSGALGGLASGPEGLRYR